MNPLFDTTGRETESTTVHRIVTILIAAFFVTTLGCSEEGSDTSIAPQLDDIGGTGAGTATDGSNNADVQTSDTDVELEEKDVPKVTIECPDEKPVGCKAPVDGGEACFPANTDCESVHENPDGAIVSCKAGEKAHIAGNGYQVCCGETLPHYCPEAGEYIGGCHPEGMDCSTLKQCGNMWALCPEGSVSACDASDELLCCGGLFPEVCPPTDSHGGFCAPAQADCEQAITCDEVTWQTCSKGETAACNGAKLVCCGADTPLWCGAKTSAFDSFQGQCFPPNTNCASVSPAADGSWIACQTDQQFGLDIDDTLVCCNEAMPTFCELYSGTDGTFTAKECLPGNVECKSLTKDKTGAGWKHCSKDQQWGTDSDGALHCCADDTPHWCDSNTDISNGDAAYAHSLVEKGIQTNCDKACKSNGDCVGSTPPLKCKSPSGASCSQCVANPALFPTKYDGGCWPAGQDCSQLFLCGGTVSSCNDTSCYCWDGALYTAW